MPPLPPITVRRAAARRFLVRAFALDGFQTLARVPDAIERLEFVQEDSINICGRIHDLILWARVQNYTPSDLHQTLYAHPRQAFEYYFPNLSVLPIADYAYFVPAMQARQTTPGRWHGLTDEEAAIAERLLAAIDADGPLRTRATGTEDGYTLSAWRPRRTVAAHTVEKLWLHGRLTISHRENFERWFDRTERLLPHVGALPLPDTAEVERFRARKRLRARRLFRLKTTDRAVLGADAVAPVTIEGTEGRPWYVLAEDVPTLQALNESPIDTSENSNETAHFLAPLDPLVYDRERNRALWDFDYIWEVYTPAEKRRWGYYVLPILLGDCLVGRIDPKIDRKSGTLTINALTFEPGVRPRDVVRPVAARLAAYGRWLGTSRLDLAPTGLPATLRRQLEKNYA